MILRIISSRPVISLITALVVILCLFFIHTKEQETRTNSHNHLLFAERSKLPTLTSLPLPIDDQLTSSSTLQYRKVELKGRFLAEHAIYLENRTSQNNPIHNINNSIGYHVIMPFLLSSGEIVWVNRGWIGKDPISRENIPEILTPTGEVNIGGYISFGEKSIFNKPSIAPHYIHGHSIALTFFLEDAKKDLPNRKTYPFLITQTGKATDGLIRPEVNFFYFSENSLDIRTWWFIQLVTLIFWLISGIVHIKNNPTNNNSNSTAD